jgi:hypothetical protein
MIVGTGQLLQARVNQVGGQKNRFEVNLDRVISQTGRYFCRL